MDYQQAKQALSAENLAPIYCIWGSEIFLQQDFLHTLLDLCHQEQEADVTKLDLDEVSLDQVLDEAEMYSFFADRRIIIAENASFLTAQPKQKLSDSQQARLMAYLDQPNEASVLIFMMNQDQLDKRKKLTKAMQAKTCFVDVSPLDAKQVSRYISTYMEYENMEMSREAVNELLVRVHYQLTDAMNELSKLRAYASSGKTVTLEVVRQLVPRTLETDVFELTNALLAHQVQAAAQIYQDLLLMKHEPIALHALIVAQFRLMIQTKILAQTGLLESDMAKQLSIHPYRVKLALQAGRSIELSRLVDFYQELIEADYQMKTGIGIKETYFYLLLTKSVHL
ncbi:DNA polymerase III subunit delta [Vaginisenegalia massiliensis]|uniref:DNA polymerase III subunit delta n=1 Tax=Vaginisenegalia massiliensis TaxID=2058294 RepID=UPI000F548A88|nr:DNA polymerase III subunit delta [Vaginisenegalia massiliensis]